ncbi:hypothetical protein MTBBW1_130006 [Desulfamplus magnetovallimortis]|uniref:PilZ domain-containing protein n=1 Tax=Desulfamplus magnetovallimortis TaxID=1246637 RepID=A0A1W1H6Y9_9BACT|nr:hypothetical protein [Desulfamplus magnetovallimortis]SLM28251.1 hypothetical protein MTBBW1_130006 [Desulfamplus magnetovallimortis]
MKNKSAVKDNRDESFNAVDNEVATNCALTEISMNQKSNVQDASTEKNGYPVIKTAKGFHAALPFSSYKTGKIVNISKGGIVFKYTEEEEEEDELDPIPSDAFFLGEYGFYMEIIPEKIVEVRYDSEIDIIELYEENIKLLAESIDKELPAVSINRIALTELNFKQIFAVDKYIRDNVKTSDLPFIEITLE